MAKAAGDGSDVDAGGEQAGGREVTEVVEANAGQFEPDAEPTERQRHAIGSPWLGAAFVVREQERFRVERDRTELRSRLHHLPMSRQLSHRSHVQRDASRLVCLRVLLDDLAFRRFIQRSLNQKSARLSSMSDQRRPHNSPRRAPVITAR